jgi:hypothetical protein
VLEESDIYKVVGDRMYILNRFRGLMVADVGDARDLKLLGQLSVPSTPREMWVRGDTALVIASRQEAWGSGWGRSTVDVSPMAAYSGSALLAVDVADPAKPTLVGMLKLGGDCFDGRLSGGVLYVACGASRGTETAYGESHVYSVDVTNARSLHVVGDLSFPRAGADHHIHVTPQAIFLAEVSGRSDIHYVDISSLAGVLQRRGTITLPGQVIDRFAMDAWQGFLRVATGTTATNGDAAMYTVDLRDPDAPALTGQVVLRVNEQVTSARFDGPRGYLVTFRQVDPLFTFDLADPSNPRLLGALEMTGWLDHMVPFGNRVVAMGHEDVAEDVQAGWWGTWTVTRRTLAVSLIDVEGTSPRLLSRVVLDGRWGEIPAERDDYNKLFRVVQELGLVLFPYRTFKDGLAESAGLLLIDWKDDTLTRRADITDAGLVERGILKDANTLLTLSVQALQAFDITDRGNPRRLSHVGLARQTTGVVVLDNGTLVEVSGDLGAGPAQLTARQAGEDGEDAVLSSREMDAPMGRLFSRGNHVFFAGVHRPRYAWTYYDTSMDVPAGPSTTVTVLDYADPGAPRVVSTLDLGREALQTSSKVYGAGSWGEVSMASADAAQVDGKWLVLVAAEPYQGGGCMEVSYVKSVITVVDLQDLVKPKVAWSKEVANGVTLVAEGQGKAFLFTEQAVHVVDFSGPLGPTLGEAKVEAVRPDGFPPTLGYAHAYQGGMAVVAGSNRVVARSFSNQGRGRVSVYDVAGSQLRETAAQERDAYVLAARGDGDLLVTVNQSWGDRTGQTLSTWRLSADKLTEEGLASLSDPLGPQRVLRGLMGLSGQRAFVLWDDLVQVYDVSDRTRPRRVHDMPISGVSEAVVVRDGVAHVAGGYRGVVTQVLDP